VLIISLKYWEHLDYSDFKNCRIHCIAIGIQYIVSAIINIKGISRYRIKKGG
jgi:hypothetical protein